MNNSENFVRVMFCHSHRHKELALQKGNIRLRKLVGSTLAHIAIVSHGSGYEPLLKEKRNGLHLQDKIPIFIRNICNNISNFTASHLRRQWSVRLLMYVSVHSRGHRKSASQEVAQHCFITVHVTRDILWSWTSDFHTSSHHYMCISHTIFLTFSTKSFSSVSSKEVIQAITFLIYMFQELTRTPAMLKEMFCEECRLFGCGAV
jgi:hypothetical protein